MFPVVSVAGAAQQHVSHMENEPPKLRNIAKEVSSEGYIGRARLRSNRRKSPWNLVLIPLGLCSIVFITYALFQMMWQVHTLFYPEHVGRFREFWGEDIGGRAFVSSFLLSMPLLFAAIPLGLIIANALAWCIPAARKTFDREAHGVKWASFADAMSGLVKMALILVPICLLLSLVGAATLGSLR